MDEGTTTLPILPLTRPPDVPDDVMARIVKAIVEATQLGDDPLAVVRDTGWKIDSLSAAEWAMRQHAAATERIREASEALALWRQQLDDWFDQATGEDRATARVMAWFLEDYQLRRRAADPKLATLRLPSGRVRSTTNQATVELQDADAVLAWLASHELDGDVVVDRSPRLRWAEVKKRCRPHVETDDDGNIVHSCVVFVVDDERSYMDVDGVAVVASHTTAKVAADA